MMGSQTLLRIDDVRPRAWEAVAFAFAVIVFMVMTTMLRLEPEYMLTVADAHSGTIVVVADRDVVQIEAGSVVVVTSVPTGVRNSGDVVRWESAQPSSNEAVKGIVESGDVQEMVIRLDGETEVGIGDAVIVKAEPTLALEALVGRILR
ncbi:hypothetical protein DRB06_14165 [Actinomyces sp. Z5]|nr:hypothetical protein DRB06_14165 [Actinomyces sp. Z5]